MILVLGDRIEIFSAVISAAPLYIPIAHIHGGDIAENSQIDEQIRHAITKMSHVHFAATELSKKGKKAQAERREQYKSLKKIFYFFLPASCFIYLFVIPPSFSLISNLFDYIINSLSLANP